RAPRRRARPAAEVGTGGAAGAGASQMLLTLRDVALPMHTPDDERAPPPAVVTRLLRRHREPDPLDELSEREGEVLGLVAEGCSNAAIAKRLFVTERTVEWHVKHIFRKLQIDETPETNRRVLAALPFLRSPS